MFVCDRRIPTTSGQGDKLVLYVDDLIEMGTEKVVAVRLRLLFRSHSPPEWKVLSKSRMGQKMNPKSKETDHQIPGFLQMP